MSNPIEPAGRHLAPRPPRGLPRLSGRSLLRGLAGVAAWARLAPVSPHLGEADGRPVLDPQRRALLWPVFVETVSAIAMLATPDGSPEAALSGLASLSERVRDQVAAVPPRPAVVLGGAASPQFFALQMLASDLQPCLGRWQLRLARWRDGGRRIADWPLIGLCRGDLERTRLRLVERAWQLGMALDLAGLEKLLPARGAAPPELLAAAEIAAAEAGEAAAPDPAALQAGWRIYVEAAVRLPASDWPSGPGALGEAVAALAALAAELGGELKAMLPAGQGSGADSIQALAFALLAEGVQPFLAEWRPRYRKFAASRRPEAKWRQAEACGAALAAAADRCRPMVRRLGDILGAPNLPRFAGLAAAAGDEAPLQLPPPVSAPP